MAEIPGPRPLPIIGNLHQVKKPPCLTFYQMARVHGEIFQIHLGPLTNVVLNSAEALRQAFSEQGDEFSSRSESFTMFRLYKEVRGEDNSGVTVRSCTDIWHVQHTVTARAIRYYILEAENNMFEKSILSEASSLANTWVGKEVGASCVIDPTDSLQKCVAILKGAYILGNVRNGIDNFDKRLHAYVQASVEMLEIMRSGFINDVFPFLNFLTKSKQNRMRQILSVGAEFQSDIYKAHEASYVDGSKETVMDCFATFHAELEKEEPERPKVARKTVCGVIPELFEGISNNRVSFLQLILYMIYFPEVQEKVRKELKGVVGTSRCPSFEDRQSLPYTEAVMYEVWRHSSVIHSTVPHTASKDVVLGGRFNYAIPKGSIVVGNLYAIHKDANVWDKPYEFIPTRYIDQDGRLDEQKVSDTMIFSIGKRSCIAEFFVRRELFLLYSTLLHLCRFENDGSELTMQKVGGILVPGDGSLKIKITRTEVERA